MTRDWYVLEYSLNAYIGAPRVPKVVDYFVEHQMACFIMEHIDATTLADNAYK